MHPKYFKRFTMKQQLQHPDSLASNLSFGELLELRHADLVGNLQLGELFLIFPDAADFGAGVNTCGNFGGQLAEIVLVAKNVIASSSALGIRRASQGRNPHNITDGVDVICSSPKTGINL